MNTKVCFVLFFALISCKPVQAGLNKFTFLKEVQGWIIERKIDIDKDQIQCRASIPLYGTWFSSRIRLDRDDQLVLPPQLEPNKLTSNYILEKIRLELRECRRGLIYIPK